MISIGNTDLGSIVKRMREIKGMSRMEVSDAVGISESHLKKIENGLRKPGFETYQKIMEVLDADVAIRSAEGTVKGDCATRAQKVFQESTESQVVFLVQVLEFMAQSIKTIK